jgi:glycosyltransferase involved in cell wall biosynthesis
VKGSTLRVGIVVPRFAPYRGGVETYVASAATALAAHGTEVTVITQTSRASALPGREERDGYTVERHRLPVAGIFDLPAPSATRAAARPGRFDVVWVHSYHTPLAWLAAEQAAAPVVFTPHYHGVGHTPLRQAMHRVYRPAGRRLMAASRRIVVDTDAEASLVLRDFPGQVSPGAIAVVPPVVTAPVRGRQSRSTVPNLVLTVARQEPYKRTELLVRAVAELRDRDSPARLVVVGDGPALAAHRELAARLGVEDAVTFTGAVSDDELRRRWASASLYATSSTQEAYGIGLAEALIAGLPVVASDIPAHREVIRRAGPYVASQLCPVVGTDAETARRYADAIFQLLPAAATRRQRASLCTLPSPASITEQLLGTLTAASQQRAR